MAASYNELFGDASLEGFWPLQDDAASTSVADESGNGNSGTLAGGDNTADISTTGPNAYLTKALDLDGANDYVELATGAAVSGSTNRTNLGWVNFDSTSNGATFCQGTSDGNGDGEQWRVRPSSGVLRLEIRGAGYDSALSLSASTWGFISARLDGTTLADCRLGVDGSYEDASGADSINTASEFLRIGARHDSSNQADGRVAGWAQFSRSLTDSEVDEAEAGPEVNYVSGATFGDDGAYSVGTWALPSPFSGGSNGTPTYIVTAVNAAGDVLESNTTSTGTLDLSGNAGNTCYLLVRATNSGGYDVGDYATRTSGFGSAGDGYYEVASVVAAGGGGGVSGSGSSTAPAATSAGSGAVAITGTGAAESPSPVSSGAGAVAITGSGAAAAPSPVSSGAGTVADVGTGTGAMTAPNPTSSGAGSVAITGTGSATSPNPSSSGVGAVAIAGAGGVTAPNPSSAGSGAVASAGVSGSGESTAPAATSSGVGVVPITGAGSSTAPSPTAAGEQTPTVIIVEGGNYGVLPASDSYGVLAVSNNYGVLPASDNYASLGA